MSKIRVVFMGTPSYATKIFKALYENPSFLVTSVFTQPDKPAGRGKHLTPPDIKQYIIRNDIDVQIHQPNSIKDDETIQTIKAQNPDFIVVAAYGKILPSSLLSIAPCINLHASLLPKYRGASPIQYAILNNDRYSGVTSMLMEEGLDSGDMLGFSYVDINGLNSDELFNLLSEKAAKLCIKTLLEFKNIQPLKQNANQSTYSPKITKNDGLVSFSETALALRQKYLAYTPWPGIYLQSGIKLKSFTTKKEEHNFEVATIIKVSNQSIDVACKDGVVNITRLNPPSKQEMNASDYINGKRMRVADKIC